MTKVKDCLPDLETLRPTLDTPAPTKSGYVSLITGQTKPGKVPLKFHGTGRGGIGYAVHSKGGEVKHEIQTDQHGFALEPSLTAHDWRLIDEENVKARGNTRRRLGSNGIETIEDYDKIQVSEEFEDRFLPVLIQGQAALTASPFEHTLTRLTRLKLRKPTQGMSEEETAIFLEDTCEMLEKRGYCYRAIDQGITNCQEREDSPFFPTDKILLKYIHKEHWELQERIEKLHEMIARRHQNNLIE